LFVAGDSNYGSLFLQQPLRNRLTDGAGGANYQGNRFLQRHFSPLLWLAWFEAS
jgi:hypothetical protein